MSDKSFETPVIPVTDLITQRAKSKLPFAYPDATHEGSPIEEWVRKLRDQSMTGDVTAQRMLHQAELVLYNKTVVTTKDPNEHDMAAAAFTRRSIALHGQPDVRVVHAMMRGYQQQVEDLVGEPGIDKDSLSILLGFYAEVAHYLPAEPAVALGGGGVVFDKEKLLAEIKEYHQHQYRDILELRTLDGRVLDNNAPVTAETFREVVERSIGILAVQHAAQGAWNTWDVKMVDGNSCGMYAGTTTIRVGRDLPPAPSPIARDLLVHELLVHALSYVNGAQSGDGAFAKGLAGAPSWMEAQEGLASSTGVMPERVARRYGAIGLALGQVGRPWSYEELRPVELAWQKVTTQAAGEKTSEAEQNIEVGRILGRVYKGRGDLEVGNVQPVYTKDHIYYTGYHRMLNYIAALRKEGETMESIFTYLTSGLFHPYNEEHRKAVEVVTGRNLWPKSIELK